MINHEDFADYERSDFTVGGYSQGYLDKQFAFAPEWLPQDYKDFFLRYYGCDINGIEINPPAPAVVWDNAAEELNAKFHERFPELQDFYAIAYLNADEYLVFEHFNDGRIACGTYDAYPREFYGDGPYDTFTEWIYAQKER